MLFQRIRVRRRIRKMLDGVKTISESDPTRDYKVSRLLEDLHRDLEHLGILLCFEGQSHPKAMDRASIMALFFKRAMEKDLPELATGKNDLAN